MKQKDTTWITLKILYTPQRGEKLYNEYLIIWAAQKRVNLYKQK